MKKNIFLLLLLFVVIISTSGCAIKRDKMQDIDIITTIYPIEYVSNRLYGEYSNISSIFPKDVIGSEYELNSKQLEDFSEKDMFIYDGESDEREYATSMLDLNKDLKIIDASYGLDSTYSCNRVWLNPANTLMIAQNIKNELTNYISNPYLIEEIEGEYESLKIDISEIETDFKEMSDSTANANIIFYDCSFNFLKKYGFNIINLTDSDYNDLDANYDIAKERFNNKTNTYLYITENVEINENTKALIDKYNIETIELRSLETLTESDLDNNDDYISLMKYNIDLIQEEIIN